MPSASGSLIDTPAECDFRVHVTKACSDSERKITASGDTLSTDKAGLPLGYADMLNQQCDAKASPI